MRGFVSRLCDGGTTTEDQGDDEEHQKHEEENLRNSDCGSRYSTKTEYGRYDGDDEKCDGPRDHNVSFLSVRLITSTSSPHGTVLRVWKFMPHSH